MALLSRALLRLACAACLTVMAGRVEAAARVAVSGDVERGLGRLEFLWPHAVDFDARVFFGRLVVRFSEPGEFDFAAYRDAMPQYLGTPKVVGDGTIIAFPLRVPVSLRLNQDGARITIELHNEKDLPDLRTAAGTEGEPEAAKPAATAPPAAAPPPAADAGTTARETVALRVGEHPGFSRLVFDWPRKVAYRIEQRGLRVTIDFDAPAELDLSNYRRSPLSNVDKVAAESGKAGLRVTLSLPGERVVRHFLDGAHVVVDVVQDEAKAKLGTTVAAVPVAPSTESPATPAPAPVTPVTAEQVAPQGEAAAGPEPAVGPKGGDVNPANSPASGEVSAEASGAGGAGGAQAGPPSGAAPGPVQGGAGELTLAEVRDVDHGDRAPPLGALLGARKPVLLRFDWPSDAGRAAAFRRGRHLWLVFDRPVAAGAEGEIAKRLPDLAPVERLVAENAPSATVFRLNLPWAFVPELRREAHGWAVDLRPRADEPQTALSLEYGAATAAPQIQFPIGDAGEALSVRDPELDDRIDIVPVPEAGLGLKQQRRFLQFRALASYQGLAILPLSDGLTVATEGGLVVVRDAAGLLVSPGADRDRSLRDKQDFESGLRLLDPPPGQQTAAAAPPRL